jgi:cellulose synthase (UDP-forming)
MMTLPFKLEAQARTWQVPMAVLLGGALIYSIHFSGAYFDYTHQIGLGWGSFIALYLVYRLGLTGRQPWRLVFIALAGFLAVRYLLWRTFDTLIYTGPLDFLSMLVLYAAEVYAITLFFMALFINSWPLVRPTVALTNLPKDPPTVDVFIPTFNEADDIVLATATAATQLDYPKEKLRIYVIDDGGTENKRHDTVNGMAAWDRHYRMRRMAESLGIGYLTRETNEHAKAGNINHALHHTKGELILILDCDHVPTHDFLKNTVGHFITDPKLFLVQTPHFFINPCPVEKNLEGIANPSGENDMFYRTVHPAMDAWNASYFCGSAAVLRRRCLEEIGGICGKTITEDAETAFMLHSRGYNSIYINKPMVCGLSPESFDDYVIQRTRWAQGMVQMVMLDNPLRTRGLSLPQKIAYFNSSFFWLFGFSRLVYFIAPACFLIFGLNIYDASWLQILAYALPFVFSTYIVMNCIYKGTRQPFFSEIYESVQAMFLIPAVLSVLMHPNRPTFKVTPKGMTNERNHLSPMSAPFFAVILINVIALVISAFKWFAEPLLRDVLMVTSAWCIYNLYLALVSLGAFWERRQVRKFHRINATGPVAVRFPRMNTTVNGSMHDVSLSGIGFEISPEFEVKPHERVTLLVHDSYGKAYSFESRIKRAFMKDGKLFCGSEFIENLVSYPSIVSFVFGDSQRWIDNWEQKSRSGSSARMLLYFLKMGVKGVVDCTWLMSKLALTAVWKLAVKWFSTSHLRDVLLGLASWLSYRLYLVFVRIVEFVEHRHARRFRRMAASGTAIVDFPLHHAHVFAQVSDVSLTGVGVVLDVPFTLQEQEPVVIDVVDREGHPHHLDCTIRRSIRRDGHLTCGAEFNIDMHSLPEIIEYVYGESLKDLVMHAVWEPKHGH